MALQKEQIAELDDLNKRIASGYKANEEDQANLDHGKSKGYAYNPIPEGATKISGPSGLQGLTEKDIFRKGQDIYKLPSVTNQLPMTDIVNPDTIPVAQPDPMDISVEGEKAYQQSLNREIEQQQARIKELELANQKRQETLSKYGEQLGLQGEDYKKELEPYNVTSNINKLQDVSNRMAQVYADYERANIAQEGRIGSAGSIYGRQALIQRQQAAELSGLSAMAQALQGNITQAESSASKAIEMKYNGLLNQYSAEKDQIDFIYNDLNRADKDKADAKLDILNERARLIEGKKTEEINISNIMIAAAQNGADTDTLEKIMKSGSYMEAIKNGKNFLSQADGNWVESNTTDANGNPMLFNKTTGEYKTEVGTSTSEIYFTDANGDSWNIAGWATDQTKPQQMNAIAKRIGKLTEENLAEKVREFTPGLTPEMIKEASAQSGVSWEAIMTMVVQESLGGTSNVAKANNNFGGLTFNNQEWIKPYNGTKGTARPSAEGGNYIKFATKQDGLNAMAALMASYGKVDTDTTNQISPAQNWANLIAEGKADITNVPANERTGVVNALALTPTKGDQLGDIIAKEKAQSALNLINHKGLGNAVGTIKLGRYAPFQWGQKAEFIGGVEQLVSGLSLDSLIEAKSRGATFGALSDTEMRILAASATKIGTWRKMDDNGNVTGYKVGEKAFKEELEKISKILLRGTTDHTINQLENNIMTSTPITGKTSGGMGYQVIQ